MLGCKVPACFGLQVVIAFCLVIDPSILLPNTYSFQVVSIKYQDKKTCYLLLDTCCQQLPQVIIVLFVFLAEGGHAEHAAEQVLELHTRRELVAADQAVFGQAVEAELHQE